MDDAALLAALRVEAGRVAAVSGNDVDIERPVAACPGWSVGRLIGHVGHIHRWATALLQADPPVFIGAADIGVRAPRDSSVFQWYDEGLAPLYAELERGELDAPRVHLGRRARSAVVAPSAGPRDGGAPGRRRAGPLVAIAHRRRHGRGWDRRDARGVPTGSIRSAGVCRGPDARARRSTSTAPDVEGEWLVRFGADRVEVERRHAKGDVAVRGGASDLYLVLWNRMDAGRCEIFGDEALFDRFLDAAAF